MHLVPLQEDTYTTDFVDFSRKLDRFHPSTLLIIPVVVVVVVVVVVAGHLNSQM